MTQKLCNCLQCLNRGRLISACGLTMLFFILCDLPVNAAYDRQLAGKDKSGFSDQATENQDIEVSPNIHPSNPGLSSWGSVGVGGVGLLGMSMLRRRRRI
jgi:hypothetical protein